jgi:hypothetical protein
VVFGQAEGAVAAEGAAGVRRELQW